MLLTPLASCSSSVTPMNSYLLSDQDNTLSVFSVGEQVTYKQLTEEGIDIVNKFIYSSESYKEVNKTFPNLNIEKEPAYFVFNSEEQIYSCYSYEELLVFLKEKMEE
jgi:hypothetical protein